MAKAIGGASNPSEIWDTALPLLVEVFEADAGLGFSHLSKSRLQVVASHRWPGEVDDAPIPIAPDSQAEFVLGSGRPVVSADLGKETRFQPAAPITRLGYSSSMSSRLETPKGVSGLVGVYARRTSAFGLDAVEDFASLVSIMAIGLHQMRRLNTVEHEASHDELTGLLSRAAILDRLEVLVALDAPASAMMIDLDGFKAINDRHGHLAGDQVLRTIAQRLQAGTGLDTSVGRLGGDEFLVLSGSDDLVDLRLRAERLIGACEMLLSLDCAEVEVSASIGIAISTSHDTSHSLLTRVDHALYRAKEGGRGQVNAAPSGGLERLLRPGIPSVDPRRDFTIEALDYAIENVSAVFQPIVDRNGVTIGVEALARGPEGSPLEIPNVLFEAATTYGRLAELELAAKRAAFNGLVPRHLRLFVNLQPAAFADSGWLHRLADAWLDGGAHPRVTVELTERALIASPGRLLRAVEHCRSLGWKIAIDDIGARSDSLAALRLLKPDVVKLDISLIQGKDTNHATRIATAVAAYRDRYEADVIAEGVECSEQQVIGEVLGANLFQGFLFGRPGPLDPNLLEPAAAPPAPSPVPLGVVDQVATKRHLLAISRHLEAEATSSDCVLLASLQHAKFYTRRTQRQYEALARRCGFVGLVGQQLTSATRNGVRLAGIGSDDPFARRWWVVLVSSHASLALLAEEVDTNVSLPDFERLFRYRLVTDPAHVEAVARELFERF